ncbi:MAG: type II and III secretion system protein, partial [Minwuiales bacterium]|nr:type II and III secretion system protein [Minwuiales bacterium]
MNASGLIELDVVQEVSSVVETQTSDIDSPTIQQRKIESTVAVLSGETVALGGLIQDDVDNATTGLPLLSEIPVLGYLFKNTREVTARRELLVMITPRIVRDAREAREVTEELR